MKNKQLFQEYMTLMGENYDKDLSVLLIDAYWKALSKYSDDECKIAFDMALVNCKWFPKPVELIEFIKYGEDGAGNLEDIALIEADKVINAISEIGYYNSVTFDDPVTMAVITQGWGGWMKICELRDDEIKWFRKDFAKIYKAYSNQGIKSYGHLVGFHEDYNNNRWPGKVPQPVLIGDREKAQKVLEHKKAKLKLIKAFVGSVGLLISTVGSTGLLACDKLRAKD